MIFIAYLRKYAAYLGCCTIILDLCHIWYLNVNIFQYFAGKSELMRLLIYSGFNPRQKDNFGQTPLHLACINGDLVSVRELCEQVIYD